MYTVAVPPAELHISWTACFCIVINATMLHATTVKLPTSPECVHILTTGQNGKPTLGHFRKK